MDISETYSTSEAAHLLGISVRGAQLWVEQGRLQAWKTPGGHRRILKQSVTAMLESRRSHAVASATQFEVLVVEDDPVQRRLYERALGKIAAGLKIRSANNGFEGLIRIGEHAPNMLITDLCMPGIDGFEMLQALHDYPLAKTMQIVVATALSEEEIRGRGGLPTGIGIFYKPLQTAGLVRLVKTRFDIWTANEGRAS